MNFFDIQVNGYAGFDFNSETLDSETEAAFEAMSQRLERQGVTILATVITDTVPVIEQRLKRLVKLRAQSAVAQRVIRGIHLEGPFINPAVGYRGAHPVDSITPANAVTTQRFLNAADGLLRLVTLAPEQDNGMHITRMLAAHDIVVSAGHTDASLDQLKAAVDAGLSMFTHLGNGCPGTLARHDNIIQRVLSMRDQLWLCFIADGHHVPFFALRNYLALTGFERVIVTTDCMVAADLGPGRFQFGRWDLTIGDDLVARSPDGSHLVGAVITMPQSLNNLTGPLNLSSDIAEELLLHNPLRALRMQ